MFTGKCSLENYEHIDGPGVISQHTCLTTIHLTSDYALNQLRCSQDILIIIMLARKLKGDWNTIEQLRII